MSYFFYFEQLKVSAEGEKLNNELSPQNVNYMIRHLIAANVSDALSNESRGYKTITQYFSGNNSTGQINYLSRKPTLEKLIVKVSDTTKTLNTDYTIDTNTMTITWTGYTPPTGNDNISVEYHSVMPWVYDDTPPSTMNANYFPRITVSDVEETYKTSGAGSYNNYSAGIGDYITSRFVISVRVKKSEGKDITYENIKYKNRDLCSAISEAIVKYFQDNRQITPWHFFDWKIIRRANVNTEIENGIFRKDITIEVKYFRGGCK